MARRIRLIQEHNKKHGQIVHRAQWLVCDADTVIENGCVAIQDNRITYAGPFDPELEGPVVDQGFGVLMPCLVNAHTHLELSALKGKTACDQGFRAWVRDLIALRDKTGADELARGVEDSAAELIASGTGTIGDVSTLGIVHWPLGSLGGILFREYLGNLSPDQVFSDQGDSTASLAGHAPHTTAPDLLRALKQSCTQKGAPFSIHVAESEDELEFITTGKGPWADFLTERGIDYSGWGIPCPSPVVHLDKLGLLDASTVAVHMLRATQDDITRVKEKGVSVCLCPRSNHTLHGMLPPVAAMLEQDVSLCLGTDSLASTPTLNLWDDISFLLHHVPELSPRQAFKMATENGARALGLGETCGRIVPGMQAPVQFIPIPGVKSGAIFERLMS